jgi:hypothetical protein
MWRTSQGDRTLEGAEARLVAAAVVDMWMQLEQDEDSDDPWTWGVPIFDSLQWEQKIVQLAAVANALLQRDVSPMPLHAINEAPIGALFEHVRQSVQFEVESGVDVPPPSVYWRTQLLGVCDVEPRPPDLTMPDANCADFDEWDWMIEAIADGILWDDDWNIESLIMDVDPETANLRKRFLTIDNDYYTAIAPDATSADVAAARKILKAIRKERGDD